MTKKSIVPKMIPVMLALPFFLSSCQELNDFFDGSSRNTGNNTSYSSSKPHTNTQQTTSTEGAKHTSNASTSQSGTVATTVSAPVSTEKKTTTGTVESPAVPSMAPTVGQ